MRVVLQQTKGNISRLIEGGQLEQAKDLLCQYMGMVSNDPEALNIQGIIAVKELHLKDAESIFKQVLKLDPNNFDSFYNLARIYEQKECYCEAIISYKKAKRAGQFDVELVNLVEMQIQHIYDYNQRELTIEKENNIIYKYLESISSVLFIDFHLRQETNRLASLLSEQGIDVDLAYAGDNPAFVFQEKDLPYRKIVGFNEISELAEYIEHYHYDIIHLFEIPNLVKSELNKQNDGIVTNIDIKDNFTFERLLNVYSRKHKLNEKNNKIIINKKIDKKATIIIPTYNRPKYLQRVLMFFTEYKNCDFDIMVLDSSNIENTKMNKKICENIEKIAITYLEFENTMNFFKKIHSGITLVKTEFVCLCADDDFITEEGLYQSIALLEKQKALFSVKGKNLYYVRSMARLQEYDFCNGFYSNDSLVRLETMVEGFVPTLIYQVFRTDKFLRLYSFWVENLDKLPSNPAFQEYLFYFLVVLTGKIGKANIDFNIRDKGAPRETVMKNFPHALIDGTFNDDYYLLKEFIGAYCVGIKIDSKEFITKKMNEVFSKFLINFLQVPREYVHHTNGIFDLNKLTVGMQKSWVWSR